MAIVDTNTGKIIGAKRGSLTWYHEKGHIEFSKLDKGVWLQFQGQSSFVLAVLSLVLHLFFPFLFFRVLALASLGVFFFVEIYEEIWCWKFALMKKKKGGDERVYKEYYNPRNGMTYRKLVSPK